MGDLGRAEVERGPYPACRLTPFPGRIVVRVGGLLCRPLVFGHVLKVDADARPGRRAAAHGVDEDVLGREVRAARVLAFHRSRPASAACLSGELAMTTSGILMRGASASPPALRPRRRDPWRLAVLLLVVRWPRRVAEAGRFVARGELEERLERARRCVHVGMRIADRARSAPAW